MKQASRLWVRRYARPRDDRGRFLPGRELWTREDGQTRWIHWFRPDDHALRSLPINEDALRHVLALVFVIIVAALLAVFVR